MAVTGTREWRRWDTHRVGGGVDEEEHQQVSGDELGILLA